MSDIQITKIIAAEEERQRTTINLIPSENYTSAAVRAAVGSVLMHKYSEGNIGSRYYEGNENIDALEKLTISRAAELFKIPTDWGVNVQALSGSYANIAAMLAVLKPGDTILSMFLPDGGHLSHGWSYDPARYDNQVLEKQESIEYLPGQRKVHLVAKLFNVVQYRTDPQTHLLDYDAIAQLAQKHQPKMIITGGTAYPRLIDHARMAQIAHAVNALYLADIAHEAGLVAAGLIPSPVGVADIVTMTTHKTLRAARGALILAQQDTIKLVNKAVLPGLQGGPFNNNIAGICVGLGEALQPEFREYAQQIISNTQALAKALLDKGFNLVAGGGDKHLLLIDLTPQALSGKEAATKLAQAGIICNMNTIPYDPRPPFDPSGLRLGTPFITTQGFTEEDMPQVAEWIDAVLGGQEGEEIHREVRQFMAQKLG